MELKEKQLNRAGSLCSDPQTELLKAFRNEDFEKFTEILTTKTGRDQVNPNFLYKEFNNGTLLHGCSRLKNMRLYVTALLKNGANPNLIHKLYEHGAIHKLTQAGESESLAALLECPDTDVNLLDNYGNTALHYAVQLRETDCLNLLLGSPKIQVNIANRKGDTPIHMALKKDKKNSIEILIARSDIDLDDSSIKKSARDAITERFPELEKRLPKKKDTSCDKPTVSQLFNAMRNNKQSFEKMIRTNKHLIESIDGKYTLLQMASERGKKDIVDILLTNGADPNKTHPANEMTPLMYAGKGGFVDIVKALAENKSANEMENKIPTKLSLLYNGNVLHYIVKGSIEYPTLGSSSEGINHYECLMYLLDKVSQSDINQADLKGNTPLHYAAKQNDKDMILLLLRKGGYIGSCNMFGEPAMAHIPPKILEMYLDECVYTNEKLPREDDYEIILKYNILAPPSICDSETTKDEGIKESRKLYYETEPLLYMSHSSDICHLLKHPVITSFLHMKWHKVKKYFYLNLAFYLLFWAFLTWYILGIYGVKEISHSENSNSTDRNIEFTNYKPKENTLKVLVTIFLLMLIIRESLQLTISPLKYVANLENWLEMGIIAVTISILFCQVCLDIRQQISAIGILLSWTELVLLIGRHPDLSTYIEMFKKVSWNFLTFLLWYSILIIAFALTFYTLFNQSDADDNYFEHPWSSMFKTVVMLTGEFDAASIPFVQHPGTSHILFVLFVFFIAVVLFNLLNGLAVNDTQMIKSDAELVSYISQVKLFSYIETMINNPFNNKNFGQKFKSMMCCISGNNCEPRDRLSHHFSIIIDKSKENEIRIRPNLQNRVEMCGKDEKKRPDSQSNKNCFDCNQIIMEPAVVRSAKEILVKRNEGGISIEKCFSQQEKLIENCQQEIVKLVEKTLKLTERSEKCEKMLQELLSILKNE